MPKKTDCDMCGQGFYKKNMIPYTVYPNPFEDDSETIYLCEDCDEDGHFYEHYEMCEDCNRYIALTASNGMRSYTRYSEDKGSIQCVACMQDDWLENGMPREIFETIGHKLDGDFFNYSDLQSHGFTKVKSYAYGMGYSHNHGYDDIQKCKDLALELIDSGQAVIIDIEASGMGLGAYFGLWSRGPIAYKVVKKYKGKLYSFNYPFESDSYLQHLMDIGGTIEYNIQLPTVPIKGGPLCLFSSLDDAKRFKLDYSDMTIYKCIYSPSNCQMVWYDINSKYFTTKENLIDLCDGADIILADSVTLLSEV